MTGGIPEYDELKLRIERLTEGSYRLLAFGPDGSTAEGTFSSPFSETELDNFVLRVGMPRRAVRGYRSSQMEEAKRFGAQLCDALLEGDVRDVYFGARKIANDHERGLRITLYLTGVPELMGIPWEFLYDRPSFLSQSMYTPVVRSLDLKTVRPPRKVTLPLRILGMVSRPEGFETLDVKAEQQKLEQALQPLGGGVELNWLERATLRHLDDAISASAEEHILHYIGHGAYDERTQSGILLFEDEHGHPHEVSGEELCSLVQDERSLRLAVLNSCEGARTSHIDPFSGVASSLVECGIPAVIGMQFEITDEAAVTFSARLYAALAQGYPVDAALGNARKAIFAGGGETEFGTPVLFLRASGAKLFDVQVPGEGEPASESIRDAPSRNTCTVAADGSGDFTTLASGLRVLAPGGRLLIAPGTYEETLEVTTQDIQIIGTGTRAEVIITPPADSRPIVVRSANTRLASVTLHDTAPEDTATKGDRRMRARPCVEVLEGSLEIDDCEISSKNIGLRAAETARVSVRGSSLDAGSIAVALVDSASGKFEHNTFTGAKLAAIGVDDEATAIVRRNEIRDNPGGGVVVTEHGRGMIEDNDIFGHQGPAVALTTSAEPTVRRNKIHDNASNGVSVTENGRGTIEDNDIFGNRADAIYLDTWADPTVRRNKIHDNDNGVWVTENGRGTIEDNDIFGHQGPAVGVTTGAEPTVRRNKIHDNAGNGVWVTENGRGTIEDNDIFGHQGPAVGVTTGAEPTVRRNKIHDNAGNGVWVTENGRGTIEDNDIFGHQEYPAIGLDSGADPTVRRNKIHDNAGNGVWVAENGRGTIEDNDIFGHQWPAVGVTTGAEPTVRRNKIHDNAQTGVSVTENGRGTIEDNDIFGHQEYPAIYLDSGADPTVRRNKIHDNAGNGVWVAENGRGTIEDNDIFGHQWPAVGVTTGAEPTVRRNKIHDNAGNGVWVTENGRGTIEDNDIFGHQEYPAIYLDSGADPTVRRNKIHDNANGVVVAENGRGTIEDNDIFGHQGPAVGVTTGAEPTVRRNKIHDNAGNGVSVTENGRGTIEDNDIFGHQEYPAIYLDSGADPTVRRNKIHDNANGVVVSQQARGTIEGNQIYANSDEVNET